MCVKNFNMGLFQSESYSDKEMDFRHWLVVLTKCLSDKRCGQQLDAPDCVGDGKYPCACVRESRYCLSMSVSKARTARFSSSNSSKTSYKRFRVKLRTSTYVRAKAGCVSYGRVGELVICVHECMRT